MRPQFDRPRLSRLALAIVAVMGSVRVAAQEAPAGQPPLTVCIRVAADPILTPLFVNSLRRQVHDQLHHSLPGVWNIDVLTENHWLIDEYRQYPIVVPEFSSELFATRKLEAFVILVGVEYDQAKYRIRVRVIDGARLVSGAVLESETPDRQWVARAVCLAVKRSIPVVAEVKPGVSKETVPVEFVSPPDKRQLAYLLGEKSVFQPYAVFQRRNGERFRQPVPLTLLYWNTSAPAGLLKVVTHSANSPWNRRPGLIGWEAVRLNTQSGRIRLQVVEAKTGAPVVNCQVSANDRGFDDHQDSDLLARPDRNGYVFPQKQYQHVAYVRVTQGGGDVYKVPIPIVSDIANQVIRITTDPKASAKADFERRLRFLLQDIQALAVIQEVAVQETNELNASKLHEKARDRAGKATKDVAPLLKSAQAGLTELKEQQRNVGLDQSPALDGAGERLTSLAQRHDDLVAVEASLQKAIETKDAQDRANAVIKLAQQLEVDGDIDDAIQRYEGALLEQPNQPDLKKHLESLRETWRIKNPEHERARVLVYDTWSTTDIVGVEAILPQLTQAFDTLKQVGDSLTVRRFSKINAERINELQAFIEQASGRSTDDDRAEAEKYTATLQRLVELQEKIATFISASLEE